MLQLSIFRLVLEARVLILEVGIQMWNMIKLTVKTLDSANHTFEVEAEVSSFTWHKIILRQSSLLFRTVERFHRSIEKELHLVNLDFVTVVKWSNKLSIHFHSSNELCDLVPKILIPTWQYQNRHYLYPC